MSSQPLTLGFLYPGYAAEDDYPLMAEKLIEPVRVELVHTTVGEDAHRIDALLDLGGRERLQEGARALLNHEPAAAVWACTSGSFVFGWDAARDQVDGIEEVLGVPCSSTSFAFVNALESLDITKVAIAATYPQDVADAFASFLQVAGIESLSTDSEGIITATEVGTFGREKVLSLIPEGIAAQAEAILVPDTALHTAEWLDELEAEAGMPVLTANQVTMFEALRLVGGLVRQDGLGVLFREFREVVGARGV